MNNKIINRIIKIINCKINLFKKLTQNRQQQELIKVQF